MSVLTDYAGIERKVFIETGTNVGDTLWNAKDHFKMCLSVEVHQSVAVEARTRFLEIPNVGIFCGDSPYWLPYLLRDKPTTFWLDAHYLYGLADPRDPQCPLLAELHAILNFDWTTPPIILIDDAHMFDDSVSVSGYGPFWETEYPETQGYRKEDWPRIEIVDALLTGFTRTLRSSYFKYAVEPLQ